MPSKDQRCDRRRILQLTAVSASGLIGATGIGTARPEHAGEQGPPEHAGEQGPPEHASMPAWMRSQNGEVRIAVSESAWESAPSASEIEYIPDKARQLSYDEIEAGVVAVNEAIEAGEIEITNQNGESTFIFTNTDDQSNRGGN